MNIYLGEHLRPIREVEVASLPSRVSIADVFTKVASHLGANVPEHSPLDFGTSFVKYAESHDTQGIRLFIDSLEKVADMLSKGRITALDRNLRNLFAGSEEDEDLAAAVDIRAELERATGQPEQ